MSLILFPARHFVGFVSQWNKNNRKIQFNAKRNINNLPHKLNQVPFKNVVSLGYKTDCLFVCFFAANVIFLCSGAGNI